jgi:Zn-dependent M28 family amino/carboxypeptidase
MPHEIENNLRAAVSYLSQGIGQRSFMDLRKLDDAAGYIEEKFLSSGLSTERQAFTYRGNTYWNIIGKKEGPDKPILIVGAHYDTVIGTPGADDNASGIAALLELARLSGNTPCKRPVRFVAFCLEEPPVFYTSRMGSLVYAKSLRDRKVQLFGMISLEMLGYYSEEKDSQYYPLPVFRMFYPNTGNFIAFVGNLSSRHFANAFKRVFKGVSPFPVESLNSPSIVPGVDFSDHRSFWKNGYQAIMITDTAFYRNPNYHAPGDTFDTLDFKKMTALVSGLQRTMSSL